MVELFSDIKEGGHGRLAIHCEAGRIWEPNLLYHVAAGNELSLVSVNFPLPCLENAYLSKPHDYCGHIIGHGTLETGPLKTHLTSAFLGSTMLLPQF